ncbi:phage tail protein [Streptomyces sp. NPDC002835]
MALNIGELVASLRADDSGFRRGLSNAERTLAGFTRDATGQLRDMHGRFVSQSNAMGRALGGALSRGATAAVDVLKRIGPAAAGIGVGVPVAAALTAALGGLAAGAVAAGIAVKAFSLAAGPQMEAVKNVAQLAAAAEEAAAEGGEKAAAAQKAYTDALGKLPPATQATAKAFVGLKSDYQAWSDGLSSTTMPVFTKGIEILRSLLPTLTPFVKAAAAALGDMLDRVAVGVKSAKFKEWAADMAAASGTALKNFITVIGNLGKGFMGLMQAFLPASAGVTGGLVSMSAAFADWGTSLKGSEGFAQFIDLAKEGGQLIASLAKAAVKLVVALGPLIGISAQIALAFAEIVNGIPTPVLAGLAAAIATAVVAMKLWAAAQALVALRNRIWTTTQWQLNASMLANPVFLVIAAIVALVAIVVIAYQKSETFRDIVQAVWTTLKTWIKTAVDAIAATIGWFADLPDKISGWFQDAKDWAIRKMAEMVVWLTGLPGRVWSAISGLGSKLSEAASKGFQKFRDAAARKVAGFVAWVRDMPGRITRAIGNMGSLLYNKGRDIVLGLWNGIKGMGGWLRDTLMGWARDLIPGPIAKALGISSPSRVMAKQVGRWIPAGVVDGIQAGSPAVDKAMSNLATTPTPAAMGSASAGRDGRQKPIQIRIDSAGSRLDDLLVTTLRRSIRIGGGNVQLYLGQGR